MTDIGHHRNFYCHLNQYIPSPRQLDLYESRNHLLYDLHMDIQSGKRCYVTSNNKKFIHGQYEAFRRVFKKSKFKLVVSGVGDDLEKRAFLKNITTEILNYDAVFSSPTMGTGLDITFPNQEPRIDCVYGVFFSKINTHFDIDQQLGRVRQPGSVKVWVSPARTKFPTDRQTILEELLHGKKQIKGLTYYLDREGAHAAAGDHPFCDLLTEVWIVKRNSMNDLRRNFIKHKNNNGWKVVEIPTLGTSKEDGASIAKAGRFLRKKVMIARILEAPDISRDEANQIIGEKGQQKPRTDVENACLERYFLRNFYDQEITQGLIEFDDEGKMREKIRRLTLLTNPTFELQKYEDIPYDLRLMKPSKGKFAAIKSVNEAVFLREAFHLIGTYDKEKIALDPDVTYGSAKLGGFIVFMDSNRERFAQVFNKEVNRRLFDRPTSQVRSLLKLVGLYQEQVTYNKGGNPGGATFRIEPGGLQFMMGIVAMRAKKEGKAQTEEDADLSDDVG